MEDRAVATSGLKGTAMLLAVLACAMLFALGAADPEPALAGQPALSGGRLAVQGESAADAKALAMYRLYNPFTGEHFYTAKASERNDVVTAGWTYEGVGWMAPESGDPVYRLYNPYVGEHHYTLSTDERDALVGAGWADEGTGWYSDPGESVPLYREYNPNQFSCNHNYTTNREEHDYLVSLGWYDEDIAWYGV